MSKDTATFLTVLIIVSCAISTSPFFVLTNIGDLSLTLNNDKNIVGYSANGIKYDFEGQKKVAEKIGVEAYMEQFSNWFSTNTTGTCVKE